MSAISNIVAYDGAATPATHTFVPVSVVKENGTIIATYKEAVTTVPDAAQGTVVLKISRLNSGVYRVSTRVQIPTMEAISGANSAGYTAAPKVAFVDSTETVGYFSDRSTIAGRRLVRQLAINIAGSIATSVSPVTTGPIPELFDLLIAPN